jgi:hypothetical protein
LPFAEEPCAFVVRGDNEAPVITISVGGVDRMSVGGGTWAEAAGPKGFGKFSVGDNCGSGRGCAPADTGELGLGNDIGCEGDGCAVIDECSRILGTLTVIFAATSVVAPVDVVVAAYAAAAVAVAISIVAVAEDLIFFCTCKLCWGGDIGRLGGSRRILSTSISSNFSFLTDFELPPFLVRFRYHAG